MSETKLSKLKDLASYCLKRIFGKHYSLFKNGNNRTAALSNAGFWYVGDVGRSSDIAHGVLINGTAEQDSETLIATLLSELGTKETIGFYDIGCNTGYFAIFAAFTDKRVQAYGFDPVPEFCHTANLSVQLNHLSNCHIFNYAVGETQTEREFYFSGTGTSLVPNFGRTDKISPRKTKVVSLDYFIKLQKLVPPNIIMLDVEGFELEALKGARDNLAQHHPYIYYECQPYSPTKQAIVPFLNNLGYKIDQINPTMYLARPVS